MQAIILGQGNPYLKNPYLSKLSKVLDSASVPYEFWIWSRDKQAQALPKVKVLLSFGSWGGGAVNALGYAVWVAWLTLRVFAQPRAGVYFCSRLDAALPCAIVASVRRCQYVFLDRDKLSKSYAWPTSVKRAIEAIERFVGRRAALHVVPGDSRATDNDSDNIRVVRNTPHTEVIERARQLAAAMPARQDKLRVLISGLISPERGARMMREAVQATGGRIEFVGAGRLLGEDAQRLAEGMGANYRGIVSNEDALALLLSADLVLAFYDPALEINRLAEPNKWFDCAALQIPFFTNPGLLTSAPFEQHQACFMCDYGDGEQLARQLLRIAEDRSLLEHRRAGLRQLRYEAWDTAMARVIAECTRLAA
ncbi:hypothetical protein [Lysobacter sp. CA199]|uniref:hypothetical protein n=1 Tax=Lysobacter sp. CA199 TaxID=3455608 RepID=UPI003F8CF391